MQKHRDCPAIPMLLSFYLNAFPRQSRRFCKKSFFALLQKGSPYP